MTFYLSVIFTTDPDGDVSDPDRTSAVEADINETNMPPALARSLHTYEPTGEEVDAVRSLMTIGPGWYIGEITVDADLEWESAGNDEPGDQNADSYTRVLPDSTSAYYSLGPTDNRGWSLELIQVRHGEEVLAETFGRFDSEEAAKARAQAWEDAR